MKTCVLNRCIEEYFLSDSTANSLPAWREEYFCSATFSAAQLRPYYSLSVLADASAPPFDEDAETSIQSLQTSIPK
jgi:hypothetical protein